MAEGFQDGTLIEVRSEEEGFKGAWYKAKIVGGIKHNKCVVEYTDLIEREDGTELLTETVDVSFIRPVPPPATGDEVIEVGDVVDAVLRDGWWTGVVMDVDKGANKFWIAFDYPADVVAVDRSDLRPHFDWIDGKWKKPQKTDPKTMLTRRSANSNRHQRRGRKQHARKFSASTGKKDNTKASVEDIVEKECIIVEGDASVKELRGALSSEIHEIPEKKDQQGQSRDQDNIHFAERDSSTRRKRGRGKLLERKLTGEESIGAERSLRQRVVKDSCVVDGAELSAGNGRLSIMLHDNIPNDDHSLPTNEDNVKSVTADKEILSGLNRHNESVNETENISVAEKHTDEAVARKGLKRTRKSMSSEGSIGVESSLKQVVVKDSCVINEAGLSAGNDCLNITTCDDKPNEDHSRPTSEENKNSITADKKLLSGLHSHTELVNETENIPLADDHADEAVAREILERPKKFIPSEGSIGAESFLMETVVKDPCVMDEAGLIAGNDCLNITRCDDKPDEDHSQPTGEDNTKSNTADKKLLSGLRRHKELVNETENISLVDDHADEAVARKRTKRLKKLMLCGREEVSKVVGSDSQCQDSVSGTLSNSHEIHGGKKDDEVQVRIDGTVGDLNDDQPLSMWFKEKPIPLVKDDSRALLVQHQCTNANGRQDDSVAPPAVATTDSLKSSPLQKVLADDSRVLPVATFNQCAESNGNGGEHGTPLAFVSSATVSSDNVESSQSLPFVKSSPVWNFLESMDILKKSPQKPHFSPLSKCRENIREGLAIGYMVTFSNMLEKASTLKFSDSSSAIKSWLGTLTELETHGFDVGTVRASLTELLSRKERGRELRAEYKGIENEISNVVAEKAVLDQEINQVYHKLEELAKMAEEVKSRKDKKEKQMLELQSKQNAVEEELQALQHDYEGIVGSLS